MISHIFIITTEKLSSQLSSFNNIYITLKQLILLKITYNSSSFFFIRFEKIIFLSINAILNVVSVSQAYLSCLKFGIWK